MKQNRRKLFWFLFNLAGLLCLLCLNTSAFASSQVISTDSVSTEETYTEVDSITYLTTPVNIKKVDRKVWDESRKGIDYSEAVPKKRKEKTESHSLFSGSSMFKGDTVKYIFSGIAILLLAFLLYKIFSGRLGNKKIEKDTVIVSVEDIADISQVEVSDLERLLQQALDTGNFKEAVRIYYVSIIHTLAGMDLIHWKKDKTNREYLSELSQSNHYSMFRDITRLFDRIWYGDLDLKEADYQQVFLRFKAFTETLKLSSNGEK